MAFKRPGGDYKPDNEKDELTKSQLLPILSKGGALLDRAYVLPAAFLCATAVALFHYRNRPLDGVWSNYGDVPVIVSYYIVWLALLLSAASLYFGYKVVGKRMDWWVLAGIAAITGIVMESFLNDVLYSAVCDNRIVGGIKMATFGELSFPERFGKMFFCAGIREELLKAVPIFLAAWCAYLLTPYWREKIAVTEPVDAMMIGAAAGIGFAFFETVFEYVPKVMVMMHLDEIRAYAALVKRQIADPDIQGFAIRKAVAVLGAKDGVGILIPRLLMNIFAHMAYSMYFAYFIGLAVMRPRQRWKLLAIGLVSASAIHGLWNSIPSNVFLQFAVAFGAFLMMASAAMKARSLSPNRETLAPSQILDRFARTPAVAAPRPGPAVQAAPTSDTWDAPVSAPVLRVGGERIAVAVGAQLLERHAPGVLAQGGDGVIAVVEANPNDAAVLGIKNLSTSTWRVTTDAGELREIAPGRAIRVRRGMKIDLGGTVGEVV